MKSKKNTRVKKSKKNAMKSKKSYKKELKGTKNYFNSKNSIKFDKFFKEMLQNFSTRIFFQIYKNSQKREKSFILLFIGPQSKFFRIYLVFFFNFSGHLKHLGPIFCFGVDIWFWDFMINQKFSYFMCFLSPFSAQ